MKKRCGFYRHCEFYSPDSATCQDEEQAFSYCGKAIEVLKILRKGNEALR